MKNWTIGKRVIVGFAAILVILAMVALTSFTLLNQIKAHQQDVLKDALPGVSAAGQIKYLASEIELSLSREINAKTPEARKAADSQIEEQQAQISQVLNDYEKTITRADDKEQFTRIKTAREADLKIINPCWRRARRATLPKCSNYFPEWSRLMRLI